MAYKNIAYEMVENTIIKEEMYAKYGNRKIRIEDNDEEDIMRYDFPTLK